MKLRGELIGTGKFGNIIGCQGFDGEWIARKWRRHIYNPNTQPQRENRMKMSVFVKTLGDFSEFVKQVMPRSGVRSAWSDFIKRNIKTAITGTYPNYQVDYTLLQITSGKVDLPYSPNATADGTTLSLTWADNSGMGNAHTDDKVCVIVYNPAKGQTLYNVALAERNERNATLSLPTAWTGDTVNVWMSMKRYAKTINGVSIAGGVSDSTFLASLPL